MQYTIANDEIMVSFEVKSLFSSIPEDLALTITKEQLQQDQTQSERTNMSVSNIVKLQVVLTHNYFRYDGNHYKQIFGCAMGSPITPVLAILLWKKLKKPLSQQLSIQPNGGFAMLTTVTRA